MIAGGEIQIADQLYRELILDHYKAPRNRGKMENPDVLEMGINPLCGDELKLYLKVKNSAVTGVSFLGKGCSISQAAASMMTEAVRDKSVSDVERIIADFKGMMLEGKAADGLGEELEDSKSLEGVKNFPVRIKCALLPWNTLLEALKKVRRKS